VLLLQIASTLAQEYTFEPTNKCEANHYMVPTSYSHEWFDDNEYGYVYNGVCTLCPNGKTSVYKNHDGISFSENTPPVVPQCTDCPANSYKDTGQGNCNSCPTGKQSVPGTIKEQSCTQENCPANDYLQVVPVDAASTGMTCSGSCKCQSKPGAVEGVIEHDTNKENYYDNDELCTWTLSGRDSSAIIRVDMTWAVTELDRDILYFSTCTSADCTTRTIVKQLSGYPGAQTISVQTQFLRIVFDSDGSLPGRGFQGRWNVIDDVDIATGVCVDCSPNSHSAEGSVGESNCVCDTGYAFDMTGVCQECVMRNGECAEDDCEFCSAGSYAETEGMETCELCGSGKFVAIVGQSECESCPAGISSVPLSHWCAVHKFVLQSNANVHDWNPGDQLHVISTPEHPHLLNPTVLQRIDTHRIWSPINVNPLHTSNETRYVIIEYKIASNQTVVVD